MGHNKRFWRPHTVGFFLLIWQEYRAGFLNNGQLWRRFLQGGIEGAHGSGMSVSDLECPQCGGSTGGLFWEPSMTTRLGILPLLTIQVFAGFLCFWELCWLCVYVCISGSCFVLIVSRYLRILGMKSVYSLWYWDYWILYCYWNNHFHVKKWSW